MYSRNDRCTLRLERREESRKARSLVQKRKCKNRPMHKKCRQSAGGTKKRRNRHHKKDRKLSRTRGAKDRPRGAPCHQDEGNDGGKTARGRRKIRRRIRVRLPVVTPPWVGGAEKATEGKQNIHYSKPTRVQIENQASSQN